MLKMEMASRSSAFWCRILFFLFASTHGATHHHGNTDDDTRHKAWGRPARTAEDENISIKPFRKETRHIKRWCFRSRISKNNFKTKHGALSALSFESNEQERTNSSEVGDDDAFCTLSKLVRGPARSTGHPFTHAHGSFSPSPSPTALPLFFSLSLSLHVAFVFIEHKQ